MPIDGPPPHSARLYLFFLACPALLPSPRYHASQDIRASRRGRFARVSHDDGRPDDAAWAKRHHKTEFVQSSPDEGKPPTQRTELRILYDAGAIYIGARMYDSLGASGIRSVLARRDQVMNGDNNITSDNIALVFDTFRDKNSRTWFELNPDGVKRDYQNGDPSSDPVWEGASKIDSLGWTAEFRIPFSQLRFPVTRNRLGACKSGERSTVGTRTSVGVSAEQRVGGPAYFGTLEDSRELRHLVRWRSCPMPPRAANWSERDPATRTTRTMR